MDLSKLSPTVEEYVNSAFHFLKLKDLQKALEYFKLALSLNPTDTALHNNLGNVYVALNNNDAALAHFNQALRFNPFHPEIYNNLGRLFYKQSRYLEAIPYFEKAIRMNKDYFEAHYNLAHSLSQLNRLLDAITHYREAIKLIPNHPNAHFNLGLLYLDNTQYPEAIIHLKNAFQFDPSNAEAIRQLGYLYVTMGNVNEAINAYQKTLTLLPEASDIHHNLAILYLRNEERENALSHFEKSLNLNPNNDTARHMVTALQGRQEIQKASGEYITALFDQYADYYDSHVKNQLNYEVPGLLRNAMGKLLGTKLKTGRILDLGCGSGLCGVYFRDLAYELIGVDLSNNMLAKANALNAYDYLIHQDIHRYLLDPHINLFDLIVAGDVLVYTGDLEPLFNTLTKVLSKKGYFAFTIELLTDKALHYFLQPTGRFAHAESYIYFLTQKYHFRIDLQETIILRKQDNKILQGLLFVVSHSEINTQ